MDKTKVKIVKEHDGYSVKAIRQDFGLFPDDTYSWEEESSWVDPPPEDILEDYRSRLP